MKRTKSFGTRLFLFLITIMVIVTWVIWCPLCIKDTADIKDAAEPLTKAESKFVGTWVLDDIGYIDYSGTSQKIFKYPSDSSTFDSLCKQYLNKTKIIFYDYKNEGEIAGILHVSGESNIFSWHGWNLDENVPRIDFVKKFKLLSYSSKTDNTSSVTISYAVIMDDGELYISPTTYMKYIFKKQ